MDKIVWFVNNAYKYEEELISWRFTLCATACYLVAVLLGQRFMKNRTGWGLKTAMTVHNVILFVWSLVMFSAGVYEAIKAFSQHPFLDVYCAAKIRPGSDRIMTGSVWFWIWLFFISKFYEFADTGFIILRKSKLIFLHVYVRTKFWSLQPLFRPSFRFRSHISGLPVTLFGGYYVLRIKWKHFEVIKRPYSGEIGIEIKQTPRPRSGASGRFAHAHHADITQECIEKPVTDL